LGIAAALGVITFNLALGVVIGLLGTGIAQGLSISGSQPNPFVRAFRAGVGITLMALGTAQLRGVNLKPMLADALAWRVRPRRDTASRNPMLSLYLYGLGYNAAGMGCTGPILAGLVIYALAAGGFAAALSAFLVFSATMGGLMLLISLLVATSQDTLIRRLKTATPHIKIASSLLLIGVGLFNLISALDVGTFVRLLFP
jgi:cytochrome c biogenesis protein CcdA